MSLLTRVRLAVARRAMRFVLQRPPSPTLDRLLAHAFSMAMGDRHPPTLGQVSGNVSWLYAANRQLGGRAIRVKPQLMRVTRGRGEGERVQRTQVFDHPLLDLLAKPNSDLTGKQFHWKMLVQMNTVGRSYVLVEPKVVDLTLYNIGVVSRIARMRLLDPERATAVSTNEREFAGLQYTHRIGGGTEFYAPAPATDEERALWKRDPYPFILRPHLPAPDSSFGMGPIEAAQNAFTTMNALNEMWRARLDNGVHAGLVFLLKQGGLDDAKRFEEAVLILKKGIGQAGEPLVLPKALVDIERAPDQTSGMPMGDLGAASRKEVLATAGASDGMVGIAEAYNRANIDGIERIMALGTIDPMNTLIADVFSEFLLPLYGGQSANTWFELEYPSVAVADDILLMGKLTAATGGGIYTPNEARIEIGKEPLAGGDELSTSAPDPMGALPPMPFGGMGMIGAGGEPMMDRGRGATADCGCGGKKRRARSSGRRTHTRSSLRDARVRAVRFARLESIRTQYEAQLAASLASGFRLWRDEAARALEALGVDATIAALKDGAPKRADPDRAFAPTWWAVQFGDTLTDWLRGYLRRYAVQSYVDLGLDGGTATELADLLMVRLAEWIDARGRGFGTQIVGTQMRTMLTAIDSGVIDTLDEVRELLVRTFPTVRTAARVVGMSRTEAGFAAGQAIEELALALVEDEEFSNVQVEGVPVGEIDVGLMWLSMRDDKVRDSHFGMDGEVVPMGGTFDFGAGCQMKHPADFEGCDDLGQLMNCRCVAVVVPLEKESP